MIRLFVLAGALAACVDLEPSRVDAPADTMAGEVAFEMAGAGGAALVVPITINGQGPYDFIVDTGATVTCVDPAVVIALNLPEVPGAVGIGAGVGSQGSVRLVTIDSLTVGNATAFDLEACVVDLQHLAGLDLAVDGLVGLNFLMEFHVVLDFERNTLRLTEPAGSRR